MTARKKTIFTIIIAFLSLLPAAAPCLADKISGIAATVNDDVITLADTEKEAKQALDEAAKGGAVSGEARKQVLKDAIGRLVDKKLVEQKIRELNIRIPDEEIRQAIDDVKKQNKLSQEALVSALAAQGLTFDGYKSQLREQLERLRLVSQEVRAKVVVSDQEMQDYYEQNASTWREEESYRARHIFFRLPKTASQQESDEIFARATAVRKEALAGADFAKLAERESQDPSAKDGGSLGLFRKSDMIPELQQALEKLRPSEVSEPVRTPVGVHIVKLEERVPAKQKTFDEVRGEIEEKLYRKKSEDRFNQWVTDLKKEATIDIRL
jgi:peptidyl-prolyl cis-trans isomerase SurA